MNTEFKHSEITERIIGAAFKVHGVLGPGFLERVYENAMVVELSRAGLAVRQQHPVQVRYEGVIVGDYVADLVVEDKVIVELKAVSRIEKVHEVQLVHYLRATGIEVGLLINFGNSVEVRRKIMDRCFRARAGAPSAPPPPPPPTPSSSSDPCESA